MPKELRNFWTYKLDHFLLWCALIVYLLINQKHLIEIGGWSYYLQDVALKVLLLAFLTYTNLYLLIPYLFLKKRFFSYVLTVLSVIGFYVCIKNRQDLYYFSTLLKVPGYTYYSATLPNFSNAVLFGCFGVAIKLSKRFYFQQKELHKIQIEKLQTELKYLKAQINPHSIFNSINSVFSLIDKSNSNARFALAKFSDMLRYQLYECNKDKIDIGKEVVFLHNYIEMQKLRKSSNLKIRFEVSEDVKDFDIAPLLIVPFIENAFKYVSSYESKMNLIEISLNKYVDHFHLRVYNTSDKSQSTNESTGGIGLQNVKRRLELLYAGKYQLTIHPKSDDFAVCLKLEVV